MTPYRFVPTYRRTGAVRQPILARPNAILRAMEPQATGLQETL